MHSNNFQLLDSLVYLLGLPSCEDWISNSDDTRHDNFTDRITLTLGLRVEGFDSPPSHHFGTIIN